MDVLGKRVLVVGLARSGRAVALCLRRHGAIVTATDLKPPSMFQEVIPEMVREKIGLELGSQRQETFLSQDVIVVSPGVPWDLPQLVAAREWKVPVVPEIEAASWFVEGTLIGVTGTNGKTTTTMLLGKMLEASGFRTFVGGNIGVPLSLAADQFDAHAKIVIELSSFQLEAIQNFRPHIAVLLNLSPNHLDRHPSFEAYVQAKRQIFRNQQADDFAVLNADDPAVAQLAPALSARPVFFSRHQALPNGVFVQDGRVIYRVHHLGRPLFETREVALRGSFNLENVLAATAAACLVGADFEAIRSVVREFRGVEHRLEFVRTIEGIEFYNNSKATSVDATMKSLEAFEGGVHLIMGGKDKGAPYAPLRPLLKQRAREVLVIGAAAERIASELAGAVEIVRAGNLQTAVREAYQRAQPGEVVLLAPACSSFDQFQDYEQRGRVFKDLVHSLGEEIASGRSAWVMMQEARRRAREASGRAPEPPSPHVGPVAAPAAAVETKPALEPAPGSATKGPPLVEIAPATSESGRVVECGPVVEEKSVLPAEHAEVSKSIDATTSPHLPTEPRQESPGEKAPEERPLPSTPVAGVMKTKESETASPAETSVEEIASPKTSEEPKEHGEASETRPETAVEPAEPRKPLELEYVYEVGAEDLPPGELEPPPNYEEEIQGLAPEAEGPTQAVEDEVLPFETRVAAAAAAAGTELLEKTHEATEDKKKHLSSRAAQPGQAKLPGME